MASTEQHIFYSYWDTEGHGINKDYLSTYSKSIIFDTYNRSFYTDGKPFGNHDMDSYHGEIFNDFVHNHAYGDFSSAHGTYVTAYNRGEFAVGKYNKSIDGTTVFSVGNGNSTHPSNVFEIHKDDTSYMGGDFYMLGRDIHRHVQTYTTYGFSNANDNFNINTIVLNDYIACVDLCNSITIRVGQNAQVATPIYMELSDDTTGVFATSTNSVVQSENINKFVTFFFNSVILPKWFRIRFKTLDAEGNPTYTWFRTRVSIYKEPNGTGNGITVWYGSGSYRYDISPALGINIGGMGNNISLQTVSYVDANTYSDWEDIVS